MTELHTRSHYYQGPATVDGHNADAVLSVSHHVIEDGQGSTTAGATIWWAGALIILDSRPDPHLLEIGRSVELVIGDRSARANIIHSTPGTSSLFVRAEGEPPFDLSGP